MYTLASSLRKAHTWLCSRVFLSFIREKRGQRSSGETKGSGRGMGPEAGCSLIWESKAHSLAKVCMIYLRRVWHMRTAEPLGRAGRSWLSNSGTDLPRWGQRLGPQLQGKPIGSGQWNNPAKREQGTDQPQQWHPVGTQPAMASSWNTNFERKVWEGMGRGKSQSLRPLPGTRPSARHVTCMI